MSRSELFSSEYVYNSIEAQNVNRAMKLVLPSKKYQHSFIGAVKEFQGNRETGDREKRYAELSMEELEKDFDGYVEKEKVIHWDRIFRRDTFQK